MSGTESPGMQLREAVRGERPLQVVGVVNAYQALLAERAGFRALYLSGSGVAATSYGLPDLGLTSLDNVLEDVRRITAASGRPLLVDADTGWGGPLHVARTVKQLIRAGAAGCHIEDQAAAKRCGHRPGKAIVSCGEMKDRIQAAVDARTDGFVIMARTDALAVEGLEAAIDRGLAYVEAGADLIFFEAATELAQYRRFAAAVPAPLLANMTEFGLTPLFTADELAAAGVALVLYPLSAFRAMNQAALQVYQAIRRDGTQAAVVPAMQTRQELYEVLNYHDYERKLDALAVPNAPS